jgi:hypothetical protein
LDQTDAATSAIAGFSIKFLVAIQTYEDVTNENVEDKDLKRIFKTTCNIAIAAFDRVRIFF